jgi:hypothetical protein
MRSPLAQRAFGIVDLLSAALVLFGVFAGLPARWAPVDFVAIVVAGALGAAGVGLLARTTWALNVARLASLLVLAVGLFLILVLAVTASYLRGIYGPVGKGGAIILVLVVALALPYLVVLPGAQLVWIGRDPTRGKEP